MRWLYHRPSDSCPELPHWQLFGGFLDIEHRPELDYEGRRKGGGGMLHVWLGPAGIHFVYPAVWKSKPDWCAKWREPLD